jgi:ABC-type Na+ efflux pump permease subunit
LLLVQFFLGMITNLYVTIPDKHPGAGSSDFFSGAPHAIGWAITSGLTWLAMHVTLGLALAVISIVFIVDAIRSHDKVWIWLSVAGSLLLIGAGFNGASFLVFNHDFSSLIMAGLFALSLGCYLAGIYVASRRASR